MLMPLVGSRFFIADLPVDRDFPEPVPAEAWVEIAEVEALGMLGVEWDEHTADVMGGHGGGEEITLKGIMRSQPMQVMFAAVPTDPGQQLLIWQASRSRSAYPFRLVFPGGAVSRHWSALVMAVGEVYDAANSVIRVQATLKPTSSIIRSEEG